MDRLTPERRSWLMSRVRGKDTSPEVRTRSIAHCLGYRFRLHRRDLPGCPDIVFPKHKLVLFVHGCFWHRHAGCRKASMPKTRRKFWTDKFDANVVRDTKVRRALRKLGWRVAVVWECETKSPEMLERRLRELLE
ncbi:MAG: DNA mismatch endonuclease Vsr [Dechloromonas sp.]|nr:DNA mismatch endonuclease Vsr [Dechloromonas sp.]